MASSKGCTPLLRKAAPHSTGTNNPRIVAARSALRNSSELISSPSRYLIVKGSLVSAMRSTSVSWASAAASCSSSGISPDLLGLPGHRRRRRPACPADRPPRGNRSSLPMGNLHDQGHGRQPIDDHFDRSLQAGPHPIHFVNEADPRNIVPICLSPHRLRLWLHSGHGIEHHHSAIQNTEGALHFSGEIDVTGRIDDVNLMLSPVAGNGRRRDGDAAFALLFHPIGHRRTVVHVAHAVRATRIEQDPLGRRGLARIDVGDDPDIPYLFERILSWHKSYQLSAATAHSGSAFSTQHQHLQPSAESQVPIAGDYHR